MPADDAAPPAKKHKRSMTWSQVKAVASSLPRALRFLCCGKRSRDKRRAFLFSDEGHMHEWDGMKKDLEIDLQVQPEVSIFAASNPSMGGVVGGHQDAFKAGPSGIINKQADQEEVDFYEAAKEGAWPTRFLPKYYGTTESDAGPVVSLQDLSFGFKHPCILDLKMGKSTFVAAACPLWRLSDEKKLSKRLGMAVIDHVTGSAAEGVRLVGLKVYHPHRQKVFKADKKAGMTIGADHTIAEVLAFFLSDGKRIRAELVEAFYRRLVVLLRHFEEQQRYTFTGSSLLWVYDGSPSSTRSSLQRWRVATTGLLSDLRVEHVDGVQTGAPKPGSSTAVGAGADSAAAPSNAPTAAQPVEFASVALAADPTKTAMLPEVRLRMIDFAKTFRVDDPSHPRATTSAHGGVHDASCADEGYAAGLRTLKSALETLRDAKWALWPEHVDS